MKNIRYIFLLFSLFFLYIMDTVAQKSYTYLALGDSYTIGESLPSEDNFPFQTAGMLRLKGLKIAEPNIIAKTGWTTDELIEAIKKRQINNQFDFVSLLIGVNNQYRGRDLATYRQEFEQLLQVAIQYAGQKKQNVFVLSIPDWGATPFAEGRDRKKITREIDQFNSINKEISNLYKVNYIDITDGTRDAKSDLTLVAEDKLHPSKKEYAKWAKKLSDVIYEKL